MTYEETQLIYEDLCSRIPFGVAYHWKGRTTEDDMPHFLSEMNEWMIFYIQQGFVKPYLRPMSSMTEEESSEFALLQTDFYVDGILYPIAATNMVKWLNAHHFDYRGLIEKGLALEAPEGMYKIG